MPTFLELGRWGGRLSKEQAKGALWREGDVVGWIAGLAASPRRVGKAVAVLH